MSTGIESWADVDALGAVYPFVGSETWLVILGLVFWIGWHFLQMRQESRELRDDLDRIRQRGGVSKVLEEETARQSGDIIGG